VLAFVVARRVLGAQLRVIEVNVAKARRTPDAKAIHDLRMALRRFRTALRVFGECLPGASAKRLRTRLQGVNRRFGPLRDAQVWLGVVRTAAGRAPLPLAWAECVREAGRGCTVRGRAVDRVLRSAAFRDAREWVDRLEGDRGGDAARPFLARKVCHGYARLLRAGEAPDVTSDQEAHAFRRRCRRVRYLSEFAEPILGGGVPRLSARLKKVADALGDRHDAEVHAGLLKRMKSPPAALLAVVVRRRHAAQQDFRSAWRRLTAARFQKNIVAELRAAE